MSEHAFSSAICRDDTSLDRDVNWMSPVQGESPLVQVKELYGNFDMVTCRLSSCNPECTKYTCRSYSKEGLAVYRERLMSVNSSKSAGPDNIHPRFIKELACELALPVYILFNNSKSLSEEDLPQIWKMANVSCIFKSGDRTRACNYRPISLTSLFCRLMEKVIRSAMMAFCSDNFIFSNSQFVLGIDVDAYYNYLTFLMNGHWL